MSLADLPDDLPEPADDGAAAHLVGMAVPDLVLASTDGGAVSLAELSRTPTVLYAYPMTGRPDRSLPGGWEAIPGARGCTPEACGFRDASARIRATGHALVGISTQPTAYQREAVDRLGLPFPLLSDADLALATAMGLPTDDVPQVAEVSPDIPTTLLRRLTLLLEEGQITKVWYPVFPPDAHPEDVAAALGAGAAR